MARRVLLLWIAAVGALLVTGCIKKDYPADPVVADVDLEGTGLVDRDEVLEGLATARSPRFLGIWDGVVFDYEVFDETLLERDLERIERFYRSRGYYEAKVTAARVIHTDDHHVRVQIRVSEGLLPVRIAGDVTTPGIEQLPFEVQFAATKALKLRAGDVFTEPAYEEAKAALVRALADRGYAFVKVKGTVQVDIARHEAHVSLAVEPGKRAVYGDVNIVGLKQLPEGPVRDNLDITPGKTYSREELDDARTALVNLGVFGTVEVRQDLSKPDSGVVPVTVVVEEAELRALRLGGGLRFDVLELSVNAIAGWEHRNFLGGMRRLTLEDRPGVVLYPTRMDNPEAPRDILFRNRLRAELRQPSFIEGRTTGIVSGEYNVYPVLYPNQGKDDPVLGYQEVRLRAGADRAFFNHHFFVTPSYNWQANFPFAYLGTNELDPVRLSFPELTLALDFRDDVLDPHRGVYVRNTVQVAGHGFGGDASDVKEQPEIRTYVPISKTVTFATRVTLGFLFPSNYGDNLTTDYDPENPAVLRDQQLLLLRAFYSGGPTSNRGYGFGGVGPQGVLGFLLPNTAACKFERVGPDTPTSCLRPLGGLTLWEASAEVRFPIYGPLRMTAFADTSDLVRQIATIRFADPHLSVGAGLRYATPVGPVRLDVGYRIPGLQGTGDDQRTAPEVLGLPMAVAFGLGEAF